jgi:Asp-tRNA(Asn)/Glu-tRNA(Gln) amidotransferase C subunit
VTIDFNDSPIIALLGENEAGKTSVVKAFTTCALHANAREQKGYIRDETNFFAIEIVLQDGTRVIRLKEEDGRNCYQILDGNGNAVFTANKLAEGLPVEVQRVMGLIEEPETNELLHIRTYEDKLLFALTPNSTNYKVMYNALKIEQLTKAIKLGSTEVNNLRGKVQNTDIMINTLQGQVSALKTYDLESLVNVKNRLSEQIAVLNKLERAKGLLDKSEDCEVQLGALLLIDKFKLESVDEMRVSKLASIGRLISNKKQSEKNMNSINAVINLQEISTEYENKLKKVVETQSKISEKINNAGLLSSVNSVSSIPETLVLQLYKLSATKEKLNSKYKEVSTIDISGTEEIEDNRLNRLSKLSRIYSGNDEVTSKRSELSRMNTSIEQIHNYMKQCGVAVETCPKCGEAVVFDIDKMR